MTQNDAHMLAAYGAIGVALIFAALVDAHRAHAGRSR